MIGLESLKSEVRSLKSEVGSLKARSESRSIAVLPAIVIVAVLMVAGWRPGSAAQTLDFYFIDVEGGSRRSS